MMAGKTLKAGDKGKEVKALQEMLNDAKLGTKLKTNGEFGPETEEALKEFQKKNRLKASGVADEKLFDALAEITEIRITDPQLAETMTVRVRVPFIGGASWERVSGALTGIRARSGRAGQLVSGWLVLRDLGDLRQYNRRVGASGPGRSVSNESLGEIEWEVLSVR